MRPQPCETGNVAVEERELSQPPHERRAAPTRRRTLDVMPPDTLLDMSDNDLHARLVQRNVDPDMATLLVVAARSGDADSVATLHEIAD